MIEAEEQLSLSDIIDLNIAQELNDLESRPPDGMEIDRERGV